MAVVVSNYVVVTLRVCLLLLLTLAKAAYADKVADFIASFMKKMG